MVETGGLCHRYNNYPGKLNHMSKIFSCLVLVTCSFFLGCITHQPSSVVADLMANQRMADCKEDNSRFNFCIRNATPFDLEDLVANPYQTAIYFGNLKAGEITCMVHTDKGNPQPFIKVKKGKKEFLILPADSNTIGLIKTGRYIFEIQLKDSTQKEITVQLIEASNEETGLVPYRSIDTNVVKQLNAALQSKKITDLTALAQLYHPRATNPEGNYYYKTSSRLTGPNTTELIVTETGLMDDAVKGIKTVFVINTSLPVLQVLSMKESFLCYRSKQGWTSEKCK